MTQPDPLDAAAVQVMRDALAVVRRYRLAEVEIVVSSDKAGVVRVRPRVKGVDLDELVAGVESTGGAT